MTMNEAWGGPNAPAAPSELAAAFAQTQSALYTTGHLALRIEDAVDGHQVYPQDHIYEAGTSCFGRHILGVVQEAAEALAIEADDVVSVTAEGTLVGMDVAAVTVQCRRGNDAHEWVTGRTAFTITRTSNPDEQMLTGLAEFTSDVEGMGTVYDRNGSLVEQWEYDPDVELDSRQATAVLMIARNLAAIREKVVAEGLDKQFDLAPDIPNN